MTKKNIDKMTRSEKLGEMVQMLQEQAARQGDMVVALADPEDILPILEDLIRRLKTN